MIASAKEDALRDARVGSNKNRFKIQNEHLLPNPAPFSQLQFPGKMNIHTRFDVNTYTHLRAKHPK
jgi:hypothetical protein